MGANTSTRDVLDGIRRIVQTLRESSRWAEKHVGLSGAQLFVLQKLAESSAMSVNELAAQTHTHQSSVSAVVTRLVSRRLVRRSTSGTDRRRVELSLTKRGRTLLDKAPDTIQERLIIAIGRIPTVRRRLLAASLADLADAMSARGPAPSMFFEDGVKPRSSSPSRERP